MTRPIMAYATLLSLGAGMVANNAVAQERDPLADSIVKAMRAAFCAGEVSKQVGTSVELMGQGGKLGVIVPAPPPYTGLSDGCVIHEDGSLTDTKGKPPIPGRPACKAAELVKACMGGEPAQPKAGS